MDLIIYYCCTCEWLLCWGRGGGPPQTRQEKAGRPEGPTVHVEKFSSLSIKRRKFFISIHKDKHELQEDMGGVVCICEDASD